MKFSADKLRKLRNERGLSQGKLAGLLEWEQCQVARLEIARTAKPRVSTVQHIATVLDVPIYSFYDFDGTDKHLKLIELLLTDIRLKGKDILRFNLEIETDEGVIKIDSDYLDE